MPILHLLACRTTPLPSCISLPAMHPVTHLAFACRTPLPDTSAPRCARLVASLPGRPQPSASAPRPATVSPRRLGQPLHNGAPASNKPPLAEKRTPVWLAIWRTWAGFANSQLRHATFLSLYLYMCLSALLPPWSRCSDRRKSIGPSAPIAYATSVSPPDEAVAWPGAAFEQFTEHANPCSRHL